MDGGDSVLIRLSHFLRLNAFRSRWSFSPDGSLFVRGGPLCWNVTFSFVQSFHLFVVFGWRGIELLQSKGWSAVGTICTGDWFPMSSVSVCVRFRPLNGRESLQDSCAACVRRFYDESMMVKVKLILYTLGINFDVDLYISGINFDVDLYISGINFDIMISCLSM